MYYHIYIYASGAKYDMEIMIYIGIYYLPGGSACFGPPRNYCLHGKLLFSKEIIIYLLHEIIIYIGNYFLLYAVEASECWQSGL